MNELPFVTEYKTQFPGFNGSKIDEGLLIFYLVHTANYMDTSKKIRGTARLKTLKKLRKVQFKGDWAILYHWKPTASVNIEKQSALIEWYHLSGQLNLSVSLEIDWSGKRKTYTVGFPKKEQYRALTGRTPKTASYKTLHGAYSNVLELLYEMDFVLCQGRRK